MNADKKTSNLKPIASINDICKMINMSRARFYQLMEQGIFPPPIYQLKTKRPFFDIPLQEKLLEIRNSGIGFNQEYILFYSPRNNATKKVGIKKQTLNPQIKELTEALGSMGLDCSYKDVSSAMQELYPSGAENIEQGIVLRELFRKLKSK